MSETPTRSGFIAVAGRPNAGKSTLLNYLVGERLALVSHKANATRKRMNLIVMHETAQLIFIDTPGIHERERLLNQFMLVEALKAIGDCDLILFLAPITDSTEHYERFLELKRKAPHVLLLTKTDTVGNSDVLNKISEYQKYQEHFAALMPFSIRQEIQFDELLALCAKHMPESPYLYDPEDLTTETMREIYKEMVRESLFDNVSEEIPYESDVIINRVEELPALEKVFATIIVEKNSQKGMVIGKDGSALRRIGTDARRKMERLCSKKVFLKLVVRVEKGWTKDKSSLQKIGYLME